jgi:hypothetical protein
MGPLSLLLGLPLAPIRGVIALGRLIQERVDHELADPSSIRRTLEQAEEARAAGEIGTEEEAEIQREVMGRVVRPTLAETSETREE